MDPHYPNFTALPWVSPQIPNSETCQSGARAPLLGAVPPIKPALEPRATHPAGPQPRAACHPSSSAPSLLPGENSKHYCLEKKDHRFQNRGDQGHLSVEPSLLGADMTTDLVQSLFLLESYNSHRLQAAARRITAHTILNWTYSQQIVDHVCSKASAASCYLQPALLLGIKPTKG